MPRKNNEPLKVGISLYLPAKLLDEINEKINGKSQSEKLRTALMLGLEANQRTTRRDREPNPALYPQPPFKVKK
jgi:metal-responsive CopG/Arc/MetJ family transcriptional regulator